MSHSYPIGRRRILSSEGRNAGMASEALRIFISSPGDVGQERVLAVRVIERLAGEFGNLVSLDAVLWEHEPLRATGHFQEQIILPSETDIVICILWSRLGTRLPDGFRRDDGSTYASGTEWEFEDAAEAYRTRGAPDLLVYRKTLEASASLSDRESILRRLEQKEALDGFIERWFGSAEDSFKAAFHAFKTPDAFEALLEAHLRKLVAERLPEHRVGADGGAAVTWHAGSPFRGLEAFNYEHALVFFGRTRAVGEIREALVGQAARGTAFLLVYGMSGSGKSSLVRAGVLPTICQPGVIERVGLWRWCVLRPTDSGDLFEGLARALLRDGALPEMGALANATVLAGYLRNAPDDAIQPIANGLDLAGDAAGLTPGADAKLLLVVDQLEELFTRDGVDPEHRRAFVRVLSSLARSGRVWVIGTMRSDFYHRVDDEPELLALTEGAGQYRLLPPSAAELAQMIRSPAFAAGLRFEESPDTGERLDDVLHTAATKDPASLPLLEFMLDELYKARSEAGVLTHAAYDALGGLEGALARRAEDTFAALPTEVQDALPSVLRALVTVDEGGDAPASARQVDLEDAAATPAAKTLIDAFVAARLLVTDRTENDKAVVRIAHEALITHWPRLRDWLADDREYLRTRTRVVRAAADWAENDRNEDFLLSDGKPLAEAEELVRAGELDAGIVAFVEESTQRAEREQQRWEALYREAETGRKDAERSAREAQARHLAALAAQALDEQPPDVAKSLSLAFQSFRKQPTLPADLLLRGQLSRIPPRTMADVDWPAAFAFAPDWSWLAALAGDRLNIVEIPTGRTLRTFVGDAFVGKELFNPRDEPKICLDPAGTRLCLEAHPYLHVFDFETNRQIDKIDLETKGYGGNATFAEEGKYLIGTGSDGVTSVRDVRRGKTVLRIKPPGGQWSSCLYHPQSGTLVHGNIVYADRAVLTVVNLRGWKRQRRLHPANAKSCRPLRFSADGTRVALDVSSPDEPSQLRIIDLTDECEVYSTELRVENNYPSEIDGTLSWLAQQSFGTNRTVDLYRLSDPLETASLDLLQGEFHDSLRALSFLCDDTVMLALTQHKLRFFDLDSRDCIGELPGGDNVRAAVDPTGNILAVTTTERTEFWNISRLREPDAESVFRGLSHGVEYVHGLSVSNPCQAAIDAGGTKIAFTKVWPGEASSSLLIGLGHSSYDPELFKQIGEAVQADRGAVAGILDVESGAVVDINRQASMTETPDAVLRDRLGLSAAVPPARPFSDTLPAAIRGQGGEKCIGTTGRLLFYQAPHELLVWDDADSRLLHRIPLFSSGTHIAMSPADPYAAVPNEDGIGLWNLESGVQIGQVPGGGAQGMIFSANGRILCGWTDDTIFWQAIRPDDLTAELLGRLPAAILPELEDKPDIGTL